ncbi:NAD-P-binding protein [Multifurca ochricompacta]|uniref:NAD-P-binding protein n=1 Tax=Multifurca ochricompacta TaxID=376703 RepID=A0AAD4QIY4_9AGAM|nr:NAD-P-binding protein [Multifurca ochricompacta]
MTFNPARDIPNLEGKVVIVTGANSGIGLHTAKHLFTHGATVYLACRSEARARTAIAEIETEAATEAEATTTKRGQLRFLQLDLSSLKDTKAAAEEFAKVESRLDVLVNNAGRLYDDYVLTKDGLEQSVEVNHVALSVFTQALLPLLKTTASQPGSDVRIIVIGSRAYMYSPSDLKFGDLEGFNDYYGKAGSTAFWPKFMRYCVSKLMNMLWVPELQRRLDAEGSSITVMTVHPGTVSTDALRQYSPWWLNAFITLTCIPPHKGSWTTLFAATSPLVLAEREKYKGAYLEPFGKIIKPSRKEVGDRGLATKLWEATDRVAADILAKASPS